MLVEQVEALKSIQETYVAMNAPEQLDELFGFGKKPLGTRERFAQDAKHVSKMSPSDQQEHHKRTADVLNAHFKKNGMDHRVSVADVTHAHHTALEHGSKPQTGQEHNKIGALHNVSKTLASKGNAIKENVYSVDEKFAHPNHKKLDANDNGKVDANDFELLRKKKGIKNFKEFKESIKD